MVDTKRELTDNGVTLSTADAISPRALLDHINVWVLETYHIEWERIANEALDPPRYMIGFCHTKQCSNAAFLFKLCPSCCRNRWKAEVRETTDVIQGGPAGGLGLFVTADFEGGKYICNVTTDILPGHDCRTIRILLTVVMADPFMWNVSYTNDVLEEEKVHADAREMKSTTGLARYALKGPNSKSNVKVIHKEGTVNTWGIVVRERLVIKKGQEIFR